MAEHHPEVQQRHRRGNARVHVVGEPVDASLELEDLVVGLLMPHAELDARVSKLVVRLLQSPQLDVSRLAFRARRRGGEGASRTSRRRPGALQLRPPAPRASGRDEGPPVAREAELILGYGRTTEDEVLGRRIS